MKNQQKNMMKLLKLEKNINFKGEYKNVCGDILSY